MAIKTQLSLTATPGKPHAFSAKIDAGVVGIICKATNRAYNFLTKDSPYDFKTKNKAYNFDTKDSK